MLEIGDFIRTNSGKIAKLIRIQFDEVDKSLKWYWYYDSKGYECTNKPYIRKHSKNIIDLIEVGDYVNGSKVSIVESEFIYWETGNATHYKYIDTILTKEQFAQAEYKIEKGE